MGGDLSLSRSSLVDTGAAFLFCERQATGACVAKTDSGLSLRPRVVRVAQRGGIHRLSKNGRALSVHNGDFRNIPKDEPNICFGWPSIPRSGGNPPQRLRGSPQEVGAFPRPFRRVRVAQRTVPTAKRKAPSPCWTSVFRSECSRGASECFRASSECSLASRICMEARRIPKRSLLYRIRHLTQDPGRTIEQVGARISHGEVGFPSDLVLTRPLPSPSISGRRSQAPVL